MTTDRANALARACARARACECVRARARAFVCVCVRVWVCVWVGVGETEFRAFSHLCRRANICHIIVTNSVRASSLHYAVECVHGCPCMRVLMHEAC